MANVLPFKRPNVVPIYGECSGCRGDTFLLQLSDESDNPDVVALECSNCRISVELEPTVVIECVLE